MVTEVVLLASCQVYLREGEALEGRVAAALSHTPTLSIEEKEDLVLAVLCSPVVVEGAEGLRASVVEEARGLVAVGEKETEMRWRHVAVQKWVMEAQEVPSKGGEEGASGLRMKCERMAVLGLGLDASRGCGGVQCRKR